MLIWVIYFWIKTYKWKHTPPSLNPNTWPQAAKISAGKPPSQNHIHIAHTHTPTLTTTHAAPSPRRTKWVDYFIIEVFINLHALAWFLAARPLGHIWGPPLFGVIIDVAGTALSRDRQVLNWFLTTFVFRRRPAVFRDTFPRVSRLAGISEGGPSTRWHPGEIWSEGKSWIGRWKLWGAGFNQSDLKA